VEYLCTTNITTEDKLSNRNFVNSIKELNKVVVDNKAHHKVVIRKDFVDEYFPYNQLSEFIVNVSKINPNLIIETEDYEIKQEVDASILSLISENLNKDDLTMLLQFKSHDFVEALFKLIQAYTNNKKFELEGASIIAGLRERIDTLNDDIEELKDLLHKETINKSDVQDKLSVLIKRINYTHNVGVDEDMLFMSNSNNYDKVIYIKEVTRVQYVDTLVNVLQEILKLLYNMPTRVVTIEGYYANGKVPLYPNLKPHYNLTEKDVLSGDILMLGYQPKLFQDIMRNPSNISILIVLDRGGYASPHLFGTNVQYLFTASDPSDVPSDVPASRIISYRENTLFIPFIKGFDKLSNSEKVQKYSSLRLIKQLIKLIE
jgi:hypothetical protein